MRIGSLFSGIGGLELGLEWAECGTTIWQVERDPYCRQVLARHWPTAERYDDVRTIGAHNLAPIDILCGGFPCQDISMAGKRAGLAGERSGLWFEFARLIAELRPRFVLVENVEALRRRGLSDILRELAARGYDAWWDCLPASALGAVHQRDRLFLLAYPNASHDRFAAPDPTATSRRRSADHIKERQQWTARTDRLCAILRRAGHTQPRVGRAAHGLPARMDIPARPEEPQHIHEPPRTLIAHGPHRKQRLQALGNAVAPPVAFALGLLLRAFIEASEPWPAPAS